LARNTTITPVGLVSLSLLTNLTDLNLARCKITDEGLSAVAKINNLCKLNVWYNLFTCKGLTSLCALTKLTNLNVAYCGLNDQCVPALAKLLSLKTLHMFCNRNIKVDLACLSHIPIIRK